MASAHSNLGAALVAKNQLDNAVAASRFYDDAFTADAKLTDDLTAGHGYNAACFAALASTGRGGEARRRGPAAERRGGGGTRQR